MLEKIKGKLIVSVQALEGEPLYDSYIMSKMALAAKEGGAFGIRSNSKEDIIAIKKEVDLPIIGLVKKTYDNSEIFITPTRKEVLALIESGCDMIAIDATLRKRPNGESLDDLVAFIHSNKKLAMADISTFEEALNAQKIGFDCISTTLSGYTPYTKKTNHPDFKLIKTCVKKLKIPVIAEGKIKTVSQLKRILKYNPYSVVIGSAITRPKLITESFAAVFK